jgi:triosephosphate isomerase (TIM)
MTFSSPPARRRPLVAGNWKMHKTAAEARDYVARLRALLDADPPRADVALCPPFTALEATAQAAAGTPIWVAAQAVHEAQKGAHTGEISAGLIAATGAIGSIVGHSERRAAGETDDQVAARMRAALDADLRVILCVGESRAQREAGQTERHLRSQVRAALSKVSPAEVERLDVAYEPIWAIGTGLTATPDTAQEAAALVRATAGERVEAAALRILYGGSVTPDNVADLMAQPDVDGVLVGGVSLDPEAFAAIARAA